MSTHNLQVNYPKRRGPKSNYQKMKEAKAQAKFLAELSPEQERELILQELARRKGKKDLIYLLEDILDYPKFGDVHRYVETQIKIIEEKTRKGLLLLPRGHLKSTEVTIAWVIQQIIKNPDNRILITSGYLENSKNFLREIKGHFEKSEKLKTLYGDFVDRDGKWSETQIVVKQRKRVRKEPTIQASSVDKSQVSQHYDIIVGDDVVNRENINTKELRYKVLNYYRDLYDLLEPGGILILIGTRWHFDDLYGHIIADQKGNEQFTIMKKSCWIDEERTMPLFPEKFTKKHLDQLRKDKGNFEFACQYLNEPVDDENADFDRNWIRKAAQEDMMQKQLAIYITIDPAMTKSETADYSGFIVNGVDGQGNWNILRAYRRKLNPAELIDEIFFLQSRYGDKMRSMGIEKTQYIVGLKESITSEMMKRGQIFDIVEVNHRGRNKETRIRALTPLMESGRIIFSEYCNDVLEEMLSFPRSKNDDVLDALAYQIDLVPPTVQFGANEIVQGKKIQVIKPRHQSYGGSRKPDTIWR